MTLTRIWAAFVIIAFLVGSFRMMNGDEKIFMRMITGKSTDKNDSTFYLSVGDPVKMGLSSTYPAFLADYGVFQTTDPVKATYILTDYHFPDSLVGLSNAYPQLQIYSFIGI